MYRLLSFFLSLSLICIGVLGQAAETETILDPAGSTNSVVAVISLDPDTGVETTVIVSTIAATTAAATTAPVDDPGAQQGPVGAPPDTATITGPPQIVYTFTTSDDVGGRQVITTTFTPTYQTANPSTPLKSGSVWAFSAYTAQFGSASTHGAANALMASRPSTWKWTVGCGVIALGAGGMLLV